MESTQVESTEATEPTGPALVEDQASQPGRGRSGRRALAGVGIAAGLLVVGGGAYYLGSAGSTEAVVAEQPAADPVDAEPTVSELDWGTVKSFNEAMSANNGDALASMVSPGSPAERWFEFYAEMNATRTAAGSPVLPSEGESHVYDEENSSVTTTFSDGSQMVTTDWVTDENGLIVSWSDTSGVEIADRLWTKEPSGSAVGQTVSITSAFLTSSGSLMVLADVTGEPGSDIDWSPIYVGADGIARESGYWFGPSSFTPGAVNKVMWVFDDAGFGGRLVYEAWNGNSNDSASIELKIS